MRSIRRKKIPKIRDPNRLHKSMISFVAGEIYRPDLSSLSLVAPAETTRKELNDERHSRDTPTVSHDSNPGHVPL
jgi:hypothetical protein